MTIILRDVDESDVIRCAQLLAELQSATGSKKSPAIEEAFRALLTKKRGQVVVAEKENLILGMVSVSYNVAMRYGGEYCQLEELIVTPAARGLKLGGLLVQKVIDNAIARGCREIGLYLVATTEHNRSFYEKYGFESVGIEMRQRL
ncbi:MAG: GNAT superfamily N-acetyltransferase [Candidatus Azotimanducaceae bacterium]|jgi:GNAT superfamily N-acetyltransferase